MKKISVMILAISMLLTMAACGKEEPAKKVDLTQIYAEYESVLPDMMVLNENTMMNFLGINAEDCTQAVAAICTGGLRADEVWLIEAKDEAALERLKTLVESRITAKKDETVSYNPEQYLVVEKGVVITKGLYLVYLVSPDVDTLKTIFEEAFD